MAGPQAALTDRELDTKVRKPADAARHRAEQEAEARRTALVEQAEADAQRSRLTGEGEKAHRAALADAVPVEGEAEAFTSGAKGAAEAEVRHKQADAFARYADAAVVRMLVEVLPQVVAKASEPLGAIDKMTVISTDGAGQPSRTVAGNVARGVELLSSTTGVDLAELLRNITRQPDGTQPRAAASAGANGEIEIVGRRPYGHGREPGRRRTARATLPAGRGDDLPPRTRRASHRSPTDGMPARSS